MVIKDKEEFTKNRVSMMRLYDAPAQQTAQAA